MPPRKAAPPPPSGGWTGTGVVMVIFLGMVLGSIVALIFHGNSPLRSGGTRLSTQQQQQSQSTTLRGMEGGGVNLATTVASSIRHPGLLAERYTGGPAPPTCGCDCEGCTALLISLAVTAPSHWQSECECGTCTALVRLNLQAQGITGLEVNTALLAAAFGDVRELSGKMQALTGGGSSSSASSAATAAAAVSAPALALAPCPPPLDCPPQEACPPPLDTPSVQQCKCPTFDNPPTSSTSTITTTGTGTGTPQWGAHSNGVNALGTPPVWTAAKAIRGVPAPPCSVAASYHVAPQACQTSPISVPTRCVVGRHEDHWNFFTNMVTTTQAPMALMRFVDGERMILQGTPVGTGTQAFGEDKWSWEGGDSRLAKDMGAALTGHYGEPVFYAFASPRDDEHGLRYYLERTEATCGQITYANLWINSLSTHAHTHTLGGWGGRGRRRPSLPFFCCFGSGVFSPPILFTPPYAPLPYTLLPPLFHPPPLPGTMPAQRPCCSPPWRRSTRA